MAPQNPGAPKLEPYEAAAAPHIQASSPTSASSVPTEPCDPWLSIPADRGDSSRTSQETESFYRSDLLISQPANRAPKNSFSPAHFQPSCGTAASARVEDQRSFPCCRTAETVEQRAPEFCSRVKNDITFTNHTIAMEKPVPKVQATRLTADDLVLVQEKVSSDEGKQIRKEGDEFAPSPEMEHRSCNEENFHNGDGNGTGYSKRYGEFPPPISSFDGSSYDVRLSVGMPRFSYQSIKKNGRFILKQVAAPPQLFLRAQREDGRLRLHLFRPAYDDAAEKPDEEEDCTTSTLYKERESNNQAKELKSLSVAGENDCMPLEALPKASQNDRIEGGEEKIAKVSCLKAQIKKASQMSVASFKEISSADLAQRTASSEVRQQNSPQRKKTSSRDGAGGRVWAPTNFFLQKSFVRLQKMAA